MFLLFVFALPGVVTGCLILITGNSGSKKYGLFILFMAAFSTGYSYLYDFFIGGYFSMWENIHVCGACGLAGYGLLLFMHIKEYKKRTHDNDVLYRIMKLTVAAGIILFIFGIWWIIIIVYYYSRFLYWPIFWIITWLSCACCLGIGVFSFLLAQNMKNIVPLLASENKSTLFPLFRYILLNRNPGFLFILLSILCMAYQTGLFPVLGF